ncbi:hypothetical protein PV04_08109 [Phialophora macrospora]|uniref:BTB domain-containing protein n=1 Tax=Phialophora macrospora TaxID=1851006 RepID=A0A0D2G192_9EURO|nr:hypothetical protein PV04_08109 [Phialophora macrospora]
MADTGDPTLSSMLRNRKADEIEAAEEQPHPKVIEVVPNADVTFKVGTGEDALEVKVLGIAMGLASPVLSRMLFGPFVEAETKVVNLPDEDPKVFLQFCNIVHHRPTKLCNLASQQLVALAILSDMWHSQEVVTSFLFMRTDSVRKALNETGPCRYSEPPGGLGTTPLEGLHVGNESFQLRDVIDICAILSCKVDFWHATRHYLALYQGDNKEATPCGAKIPSMANPNGETVYGKNQARYMKAFVNDILACVNKDIDISSHLLSCQTAKYEALHLLLHRCDIVLGDTIEPGSLEDVMWRAGVVPTYASWQLAQR